MSLRRRIPRHRWVVSLAMVLGVACTPHQPELSSDPATLRVGIPTAPQTFNPLMVRDLVSAELARQLHASLVRIDLSTQRVEPMLAERWELSEPGRTLTMWLRPGVRFSDGDDFDATDVTFTMGLLSDGSIPSQFASNLQVRGRPIEVEALDDLVVEFRFPSPVADAARLFSDIGILPSHLLEGAESLDDSLGIGSEPVDVVGLGPFRLDSHEAGQRTTLVPNPHYWGQRADPPRPKLVGVVFEVVPDAQTNLLRLQAGELDVVERLSPDSFSALVRDEALAAEIRDIGPGLTSERLWLNLNPAAPVAQSKKRWFSRSAFRRALSLAIDRDGLARVVYQGYATPASGSVSPANRFWADPKAEPRAQDLEQARALLEGAGFERTDGGPLTDSAGEPVRFRLMTSPSPTRQRSAAFVQDDLAQLGIVVDLVVLEGAGLMARILGDYDYDACLLGIAQLDPDPSAELPIWLSSGQLHVWNPGQATPATAWEKELDELMIQQMSTLDLELRQRLYHDVQAVLGRQLPVIDLVYPHVLYGADPRVEGLIPTPFGSVLWNLEEISLAGGQTPGAGLILSP